MLNNLFGGDNENMLLLIVIVFLLLGGGGIFGDNCRDRDRDRCGGGIFGGDNIIWLLILFLFLGDIF